MTSRAGNGRLDHVLFLLIAMKTILTCVSLACALLTNPAGAAGVVPESSVLIVDEATGEGSMTVQNTDTAPVLLYTTIENIAEDQEELVVATPPMARLEAGQSQLVRFMLTKKGPLATQRLKRVSFEGIPFARGADNQVQTTFRQNIPMIIQPRSLEKLKDPWTRLTATVDGDRLRLCNDSAYVVRLAQQARLDSGNIAVPLPKTCCRASAWSCPSGQAAGRRRHGHDLAGHGLRLCRGHPQSPCRAPASPHQGNEAARARRAWLRFSA